MTFPSISILIPTYGRPRHLQRCLASLLAAQWREASQPLEILIGIRPGDEASSATVQEWQSRLPIREIASVGRGVVGAMNSLLHASAGEWLGLLDDDVEIPPDWLTRLGPLILNDPRAAGASGRDLLLDHPDWRPLEPTTRRVGLVEPWGRILGQHHRSGGPPIQTQFLRGSNGIYRGEFLHRHGFCEALRGEGAQVHWELVLGFQAQRDGWHFWHDPQVGVPHHVAPRLDHDANHRGGFASEGIRDMNYNEIYALRHYATGWTRLSAICWSFAVGSLTCPGLAQIPRLVLRREPHLMARLRATWQGRCEGLFSPGPPASSS
jgi:glycosyltransferase involved in cell wall biosynthesis